MKGKRMYLIKILLALLLLAAAGFCWLFWRNIRAAASVKKLEDGLYSMTYHGDYSFGEFLAQGGASSDKEAAEFVVNDVLRGMVDFDLGGASFGCSTLSVEAPDGRVLFGRNFDWGECNAMIVETAPPDGYRSVSTVNLDFLNLGFSGGSESVLVRLLASVAPYAPMDGMNEKGLCVAVLMIQDRDVFDQDTGKPDLTTTTAIRLLLDRAADVDEAVSLLSQYDMHASAGMMVHFALADAAGKAVVVEYVDNEMQVIETPVVTNFYLTPGEKYRIGSQESQVRYELLTELLAENPNLDMDGVRDALDRVSKRNFDSDYASTEWSIVYDQTNGEARYYHREDFEKSYSFEVN